MDEANSIFMGFCAIILCVLCIVCAINRHTETMTDKGMCRYGTEKISVEWVHCNSIIVKDIK